MSDEKMQVLRMLEQGLITYEQSVALLEALGGKQPASGTATTDASGWDEQAVAKTDAAVVDSGEDDEDENAGEENSEDEVDEDETEEEEEDNDEDNGDLGMGATTESGANPGAQEHAGDWRQRENGMSELRESLGAAYREVRQAMNQVSRELRGVGAEVPVELSGAMREVAKEMGEVARTVTSELQDALEDARQDGNWQFGWRNAYRFERTEQILVAAEVQQLSLQLSTKNGRVRAVAVDDAEIGLRIMSRIEAANEQEAKEIAERAVNRELQQDGEHMLLRLTVPEEISGATVSFELQIPRRLAVEAKAFSKNGGIELVELRGMAELESKNGQVRVVGGNYPQLAAMTKNGSVQVSTTVQNAALSTKNGSVRCLLKTTGIGTVQAESSNGSVIIDLSPAADQGYSVDASSHRGGLHVSLPELVVSRSERGLLQGQTAGFAAKEQRLTVIATTRNGSVTINRLQ